MPRSGTSRGCLLDWLTQKWVCATGRTINLAANPWLDGPRGNPAGIGLDFFHQLAAEQNLLLKSNSTCGLLEKFSSLVSPSFDPDLVHPAVIAFYENTSQFDMDAWSQWCGFFRPFGWLLARLFSRRLQQLNVPLSGLDTSRGISSQILQLCDPATGETKITAWVRQLLGTKNVLYAGSYSICSPPLASGPCIEVVFPLPNGNAIVIMRPRVNPDGSFSVLSDGRGFGDAGFYFTVHSTAAVHARYVRTLKEEIRVYATENDVRADHLLWLFGLRFLQLHYRLRLKHSQPPMRH